MAVTYEWCREYVDQYDDILENEYADKLAELQDELHVKDAVSSRVVLIRDMGNDDFGLLERGWAYPVDGVMPPEFDCGHKVPAKYKKEWDKINP